MLPPLGLRAMRSGSTKVITGTILNRPSSPILHSCRTGPLLLLPSLNLSLSSVDNHRNTGNSFSCSCCSSVKTLIANPCSGISMATPTWHGYPPGTMPTTTGLWNSLSVTGSSNGGIFKRGISIYGPAFNKEGDSGGGNVEEEGNEEDQNKKSEEMVPRSTGPIARHLDKDRTKSKNIPVETSIRYMQSAAYKETYGNQPVWVPYRRNFPGQWAPRKTRKRCIRKDQISTGNPCPLCRDIYLVVDYRNTALLQQFISPYTGEVLHWDKTGVCRTKQENLLIEIERAKDHGTITLDVPFREYDYKEYEHIYTKY